MASCRRATSVGGCHVLLITGTKRDFRFTSFGFREKKIEIGNIKFCFLCFFLCRSTWIDERKKKNVWMMREMKWDKKAIGKRTCMGSFFLLHVCGKKILYNSFFVSNSASIDDKLIFILTLHNVSFSSLLSWCHGNDRMGILDNNKTEADGNDVFDFAFAPLQSGQQPRR